MLGNGVLEMTPKAQSMKDKTDELNLIKMKKNDSKDTIQEFKGNPQNGRKYLQIIYMIRACIQNI